MKTKTKRHMTKEEEIQIMTKAALELGVDSYLGKWLVGEIPFLKHSIEQDFYPIGIGESEKIAQRTVSDAEKSACEIIGEAVVKANIIVKEAEEEIRQKKKIARKRMLDVINDIGI
jgi:cell division septum initiation protein DivIVA